MKNLKVKLTEEKAIQPNDFLKGGFSIEHKDHILIGEIFQSAEDGSLTVNVHDFGMFRVDTKDIVHGLVKKILKERV